MDRIWEVRFDFVLNISKLTPEILLDLPYIFQRSNRPPPPSSALVIGASLLDHYLN